jgi:sphinganine-1-phosphate aldolase
MRYLGEQGYLDLTRALWEATQRLAEGIEKIPGLHLVAPPSTAVLVYGSRTLNMGQLATAMEARGWSGRPQADPPSIRMLLAPYHLKVMDAYLNDLADAVSSLSSGRVAAPASAE